MSFIKEYHGQQLTNSELEQYVHYCEACCITSIEAGLYFIEVIGEKLDPPYLERLAASIEICNLSANFLLARDVEVQKQIVQVCADACESCATICRQLKGHDPFLQECAAFCQFCAQRCHEHLQNLGERRAVRLPLRQVDLPSLSN